ncbi:MAG: serine hydrolase [Anaerolineae bacterium]|nr:serine hydrolase [Anaerolineae bacterium]NUQ03875.1 serine hydrolase [Anaerolineae bacterium]
MRNFTSWAAALLASVLLSITAAAAQTPGVTAEAIQQANLRRATSIDSDIVGNIASGTRYPVVGRSALYPWLLLADPASGLPIGWVFSDIVTLQGDLNTVPITEVELGAVAATLPALVAGTPTRSALAAPVAPATAPPAGVYGTVLGEINLRYGPGVDYPRVGVGFAGDSFQIVAYHTQFPWVQIVYPASPTGFAWVNVDLIEITGDLVGVQPISQTSFNLPTLTPTPSPVEIVASAGRAISPEFRALGDTIWEMMQAARFDPATSRLGGFYLKNLQTGEALALGDGIAFSGMSLNKIAILTALYDLMDRPPDDATALTIAEAMVCSENISTNEMLAMIGDGSPYEGANRVSEFLQQIGLQRTFIFTPYANDPFITPQAPRTRLTDVDQQAAQPDPFNQITVSELGGLLDQIYQCGYGADSPLLTATDNGAFTPDECRHILNTMSYNRIGNFIESGTAAGVKVAHKHGWIEDTHGDAAVVFSPGGAYIFVIALHNPDYLEFSESEPIVEESARMVYNFFNPDAPLDAVRPPDVDGTCNLLASPVVVEMQQVEASG